VVRVFDGRRALDNVVTSAPYNSRMRFVGISTSGSIIGSLGCLVGVAADRAMCVVGDNSTHYCDDVCVFKLVSSAL
ncbi:hypothetical protein BYT27DRAFT_7188590, partial [Phlegmacium glaucopus]